MSSRDQLLQKIENRSATVAVIGLGYVGLPLAVEFAKAGYSVTGFDVPSGMYEATTQTSP